MCGRILIRSLSSPIFTHDDPAVASHTHDFPFSIDQPPPTDILDEQLLTVPGPTAPQPAGDNRLRGDCISRMTTDRSANPQLSWSSTTATSNVDSGPMMPPLLLITRYRQFHLLAWSPMSFLVSHLTIRSSPLTYPLISSNLSVHAGCAFQLILTSIPYHHTLGPRNSSHALDDLFWTWGR